MVIMILTYYAAYEITMSNIYQANHLILGLLVVYGALVLTLLP